ncbi:hypothetical protein BUALT_Bualt15G0122100 [Buddleja alternifolia]|uniref:RBR-type E3 ubiquitin transferase n=1 Tax=Buddleja alternifolia TaxID=168488 RepID=A0AAV6WLE0_9LAMI|nr:hypothetical protein BUALT_Bualt15G0122100 [Buddleja alternifolia]
MVWVAILQIAESDDANMKEALITNRLLLLLYQQISKILCSDSGGVSIPFFIFYSLTAAWMILLLLPLVYKNKINKRIHPQGRSQGLPMAQDDAFSRGNKCEIVTSADAEYTGYFTASDAEYAEEIQLQESLLASVFTSKIPDAASSSVHQPIADDSSQVFCEICLENKRGWEMFRNDKCSHSFCYDCTTGHIMSKIQDKVKSITCPALNCEAILNYDDCRQMIPVDALVKWDELLCLSLIPESHKLYCPFRDCSAMLVNDSGEAFRQIKCLACKRSFCAECRVPWHSEFTCKEFQKLYARKGGKDDKIVKSLAKKKNWQKCPKCKMYVEKAEGCMHITCRCKYEFCYRCGSKWRESHENCKPKS